MAERSHGCEWEFRWQCTHRHVPSDLRPLDPLLAVARKRQFPEPNQRDLPRPVLSEKTIPFAITPNKHYQSRRLIPHEARIASRHGRGVGCGGRSSVGVKRVRRAVLP